MAKRLWIKLWPDLLAASPRWKRTSLYQAGVYMNILIRVNEEGALRTDSLVWTISDFAQELSIDKRHTKKVEAAVEKLLRLGLLHRDEKDGALCVSRHERLQEKRQK